MQFGAIYAQAPITRLHCLRFIMTDYVPWIELCTGYSVVSRWSKIRIERVWLRRLSHVFDIKSELCLKVFHKVWFSLSQSLIGNQRQSVIVVKMLGFQLYKKRNHSLRTRIWWWCVVRSKWLIALSWQVLCCVVLCIILLRSNVKEVRAQVVRISFSHKFTE